MVLSLPRSVQPEQEMGRFCEYLADEMLEEIMSWLPPESLKRFKCVCKPWYVLISSLMNNSAFVAKHLGNMKRQRHTSPFIYLKNLVAINDREGQESSVQENYLLTLVNPGLDDDPTNDSDCIPCLPENLKNDGHRLGYMDCKLVCHCNGIICLFVFLDVFLLNPALGEIKTLPDARRYVPETEVRVIGFGCDSRANDYKVVIIRSLNVYEDGPYIAEIFTLSTDSWKEIEANVDVFFPNCDYQVVYCNGICYWYFWDAIVSFDIGHEVFQIIEPVQPHYSRIPTNWDGLEEWTKIEVWNESIVLFFYTAVDPIVIDMWVMNDCSEGVQGSYSWTKHLTIGPLVGINYPLAFWEDDELFMETKDGEIIFYNLRTQKLNNHTVWLEPYHGNSFVTHTKSLVSALKREGR